jgi:hypothetical protein
MCAPLRLVCLSFVALSIVFLPNMAITGTTRATTSSSSPLYDVEPGEAHASIRENQIILENNMFAARWSISQSAVSKAELIVHAVAPEPEKSIALSQNIFVLRFKDGTILLSADMRIKDGPRIEDLNVEPEASRAAQHLAGRQVVMRLEDSRESLSVIWRGILRNDSNYLRQELSIRVLHHDSSILAVDLFDFKASNAQVIGTVKGSPVTVGEAFFGFEHPLSTCAVKDDEVKCAIARELPLRAEQTVTYSSVIGLSPAGQMRRGFLNYLERERPRPYQPFLHLQLVVRHRIQYPYDEASALDVIRSFGSELVQKRGVKLDSFLFDDGWDDPHTLWSFGPGFPNGFIPIKALAETYGAEPGVWLSPWGGYMQAKEERLKYGRQQGLEINEGGFALSGPRYYARFRDVTLRFIRDFGVNQFKIDGTGNVNSVLPGSEFDSDFQATINLMSNWRSVSPSIFINLTTGTYPSPFWLQYADSIWRGNDDHSFAGVGSWRERRITFRDGATFRGVVQQGPLFPLNSLMLHGLIYARHAEHLDTDPGNDFANEVHSYFGSGTQLQEMYITHSLLSDDDWNMLAEAANWSRKNADILVDTHWIGGDPNKLEIYGWASWSPRMGILMLRNPSDKPQTYSVDVAQAFELPRRAPRTFQARSPWRKGKDQRWRHEAGAVGNRQALHVFAETF